MIPTMIPTRGGLHLCGPYDHIRDTREGRHIEACRVCRALRISGRTRDEARRDSN
jgi:hypothetical protein